MKKLWKTILGDDGALVAIFGQSKIVRTGLNSFEIRGGSREDRNDAYEWVSLFLHGARIDSPQ